MSIITVIGAGNGGHALAADCKLGGATVRLYEFTKFTNKVQAIMDTKRVKLHGPELNYMNVKRNGTVELDMVTTDMKEAVKGADHILISMQSQGFESVFRELAPLLEDGQTVNIFPDNFGCLIMKRIMKEMGIKTRIYLAGFETLPFGARLNDFNNQETKTNEVSILYRVNECRFDTLPSSDAKAYQEKAKEIPTLEVTKLVQGDTVLDVSLSNVNPMLHVPAVVLNVGAIENWGIIPHVGDPDIYFDIYEHGGSTSVGKVQWVFYNELKAIADSYGVGIGGVDEDALQSRLGVIGQMCFGYDFRQPFDEPIDPDNWLDNPKGARFTLDSRYITEDVPACISTFLNFADLTGVKAPTLESFTHLASIMKETDYRQQGLSFKDLGLENMSAEEMVRYMRKGE